MNRPPVGLTVIAVLGLVQGLLGILRALQWIRVGSDLVAAGGLVPLVAGWVALGRGGLVGSIALLYVLFAWGAFTRHGWAWWVGLGAALLNGLLVVNAVGLGAPLAGALLWAVVPVVLVLYLLAPAGRRALSP